MGIRTRRELIIPGTSRGRDKKQRGPAWVLTVGVIDLIRQPSHSFGGKYSTPD